MTYIDFFSSQRQQYNPNCVLEDIGVDWPEISDMLWTKQYSLYTRKYLGFQNMLIGCWVI